MAAYDVQGFQINAPEWAPVARYDIVAKVPAGATKAQVASMWQSLLKERLGLAVHHEPKEFQVYELTIAKGGPKMRQTDLPPTAEPFDFASGPAKFGRDGALEVNGSAAVVTVFPNATGATARLAAKALTTAELAARLGGSTSHPVIDKTGLTGRFDFVLEFTPDMSRLPPLSVAGPPAPTAGDAATEPGSDAAAAVE